MSFAKNYNQWIVELYSPYLGETIAEIGAGTGNLTQLLSAKNSISNITAFEPSVNMFNTLAQRLNDDDKIITINSALTVKYGGQFNSILYTNVLEHIEDDSAEVAKMHYSLSENGHALIFVPALSWLYSDFDKSIGHFRRYHKGQLIQLFEDNGFDIITVKYIDMLGILPWYLNFVLLKRHLDDKATKIYDRLVIPIIKKLDKITPMPIGKNLLLIAKKSKR
jgi:hypothetical protein